CARGGTIYDDDYGYFDYW
nr:immunoglobulin heavy chain junction region [Macaca mulatta]MOV41381.1 immunoglobulin heavy chain junction region [Macaca mulatta]MOV42504.1 immunoglobulin heavy chain junction region [Macaca mulatta]MOV42525.1 immunoglobulin heavy chain junction region [Macaca mulatta]